MVLFRHLPGHIASLHHGAVLSSKSRPPRSSLQTCSNLACLTAITCPSGNTCVCCASIRRLTPKQAQVYRSWSVFKTLQLPTYFGMLPWLPLCQSTPQSATGHCLMSSEGRGDLHFCWGGGGSSVLACVETLASWKFTQLVP